MHIAHFARTLRRGHEKACHPKPRDEALGKPYQAVISFIIVCIAIDRAQTEFSYGDQDRSSDDQRSTVSSIEKAADNRREHEHHE